MDRKTQSQSLFFAAIACLMISLSGCDILIQPLYYEGSADQSQPQVDYQPPTPNAQPQTPNPQPPTPDSQPSSPDQQPQTPNSQPATPSGGPALRIPPGQTLRGAIVTRGKDTYYYVDTIPLRAEGGSPKPGYTWSVASLSALPVGTAVDPLTGMFKSNGGQLLQGTHKFDMVVSDGSRTATGSFTFTVEKGDMVPVASFQQPAFEDISLPDAKSGSGYGATLRSFGKGALPWTWSIVSGNLPAGLTLDKTTGVVHGTPFSSSAGKSYWFMISVTDKDGNQAAILAPSGNAPRYTISVPK